MGKKPPTCLLRGGVTPGADAHEIAQVTRDMSYLLELELVFGSVCGRKRKLKIALAGEKDDG